MNKFLLRHSTAILSIILIVGFAYGVYLKWMNQFTTISDQTQYFGFLLTIFSILSIALQSRRQLDWNARQLAMTELRTLKTDLDNHMHVLRSEFNYISRGVPISVDEIKDKICIKGGECEKISKGACPADDRKCFSPNPEKTKLKIYRAIMSALSEFEYIAVGVHQRVFDKDIVRELYAGSFIRVHEMFGPYIVYHNTVLAPYRRGKVWEHLILLAKSFEAERQEKANKKDPRD